MPGKDKDLPPVPKFNFEPLTVLGQHKIGNIMRS